MGVKPALTPTTGTTLVDATSLKARYLDVVQSQVVSPLRDDLARMRTQLHDELERFGGDQARDRDVARAGVEHEIRRVDKMMRVLDRELDRLRRLRLSDADQADQEVRQGAPADAGTAR